MFAPILSLLFLKKHVSYLLFDREGEGMRKRGRETLTCVKYIDRLLLAHPRLGTWPATQAYALTGN